MSIAASLLAGIDCRIVTTAFEYAVRVLPRYAGLVRSQYWDRETLQRHVRSRLQETVEAAAKIPFYAARYHGVPRLANFAELPLVNRKEIPKLTGAVRDCLEPGRR